VVELTLEAIIAGTVDGFEQEVYKANLVAALAITAAEISLDVIAASVRVVATIRPTTRPWATVVRSANSLVLQLTTAGEGAASLSAVLGVTIESMSKPTTAFVIVPAPSPPPPQLPPALPPSPAPPPPPPYYLEWLEAGSNSLMVVSITTIVYVFMVSVALTRTDIMHLERMKRLQFVFTISLATEDFISDVLYYYVQVSPCMFESLSLSFECTTFATPALFYLSTIALFMPIAVYGIYSGFLRGLLSALHEILILGRKMLWHFIVWLWGRTDQGLLCACCNPADFLLTKESRSLAATARPGQRLRLHSGVYRLMDRLRLYSGLNSYVTWDTTLHILEWIVRLSLLLVITEVVITLALGLIPTLLVLWVAAACIMLFFGVNTKLFALQGYLNAYCKLLVFDDDRTKEQQVLDVNFSLLAEVLFESIPQFCIVFINETYQHKNPASATETAPTEAATGYVVGLFNRTSTDVDSDNSLVERMRSFSGLVIFTLAMSLGMIINELIPFLYRACKARSVVNGFYIPVLELSKTDVADVKEFRHAIDGRKAALEIKGRRKGKRQVDNPLDGSKEGAGESGSEQAASGGATGQGQTESPRGCTKKGVGEAGSAAWCAKVERAEQRGRETPALAGPMATDHPEFASSSSISC